MRPVSGGRANIVFALGVALVATLTLVTALRPSGNTPPSNIASLASPGAPSRTSGPAAETEGVTLTPVRPPWPLGQLQTTRTVASAMVFGRFETGVRRDDLGLIVSSSWYEYRIPWSEVESVYWVTLAESGEEAIAIQPCGGSVLLADPGPTGWPRTDQGLWAALGHEAGFDCARHRGP